MHKLWLFKVLKISIHFCCGSHVGGQVNAHHPIFPYNIWKILQLLLPVTLLSLVQMTSNLVRRHVLWSYWPCQNLGQIDRSLHNNHVFDDVICKQPIQGSRQGYTEKFCRVIFTGQQAESKPEFASFRKVKVEN